MKFLFTLLFLSTISTYAAVPNYWIGSGIATRSENGKAWESIQCDKTLGVQIYNTQSRQYSALTVMGGLCYRLNVGVTLRIESGNLILMKDSFGFSSPWTSKDIGKVVGNISADSFEYQFSIKNADEIVHIIYGKMNVQKDGRTAKITFSTESFYLNGKKDKTEVSGVIQR